MYRVKTANAFANRCLDNIVTLTPDPIIGYSGEETSGLESSFTSPSVHKDFIDQYLTKLSYLPGDVISNSEPGTSESNSANTSYNASVVKNCNTALRFEAKSSAYVHEI
jgi:hypothetical protein